MGHDHWAEVEAARRRTLRPTEAGATKLAAAGKLHVRERLRLLLDEGSFV